MRKLTSFSSPYTVDHLHVSFPLGVCMQVGDPGLCAIVPNLWHVTLPTSNLALLTWYATLLKEGKLSGWD